MILSPHGPVVIDSANAARGAPGCDVALSAVVLASAPIGPPLSWLRDGFVRSFLGAFSDNEWRDELDRAIAFRMRDANVSDVERARLAAFRL